MRLFESTLKKHPTLNPKLWDGEKLKPDVRAALLAFGRAWQVFAKIPDNMVRDVIMIGGNASYFYNDVSDIDVHLLVSRAELGFGPIVDDFLADRKALWTVKHHAKVKGYPLEPYAQDIAEPYSSGQGVYSLTRDEWIQKPTHADYDPEHDRQLARKVTHWSRVIRDTIAVGDADKIRVLKDRLRAKRGLGIKKTGELNQDNLVFKELRNLGLLDKMDAFLSDGEDAELTLEGKGPTWGHEAGSHPEDGEHVRTYRAMYRPINQTLRHDAEPSKATRDQKKDAGLVNKHQGGVHKAYNGVVGHLDRITSHKSTGPSKLYRAIHDHPSKFPEGHEFTDHGFTSTTKHRHVAQDWRGAASDKTKTTKPTYFRIHAPAGTKGRDISGVHDGRSDSWASTHSGEVLLHRGTKFKVGQHHVKPHEHVIDLHVQPHGDA